MARSMYRLDRATGRIYDEEPALPNSSRAPASERRHSVAPQAAHDAAHGPARDWARIRSGWVPERLMPSVPLTDAIIEKRRKQGYFTEAHKEAIRLMVAAQNAKSQEAEE